ncbi:MAG: YraN family protein, partial [Firmicutes bacterium]|nr:YraN family protein [Bacillota bacterium]
MGTGRQGGRDPRRADGPPSPPAVPPGPLGPPHPGTPRAAPTGTRGQRLDGPGGRLQLGRWGEALAALYLQGLGYQVLARNLRNRLGELDLVALDGEILVFVEVRTRRGGPAGTPEESV